MDKLTQGFCLRFVVSVGYVLVFGFSSFNRLPLSKALAALIGK